MLGINSEYIYKKNQPILILHAILSRRVVRDEESLLAQTEKSLQTGLVLGEHQKLKLKVRCQCVTSLVGRLSAVSTAAWKPHSDVDTQQQHSKLPCRL